MKSLLKLKPYLMNHLWLLIASSLLGIPLALLRAAPAPLVQKLIDELKSGGTTRGLWVFPSLIVGLYAFNFIIRFLHVYLSRLAIYRVERKLKSDLFSHLLNLSADYFSAQKTGALIARVGVDPSTISGAINSFAVLIREPLTFLALLGYAFYLNWKLTLITLGLIPILAFIFSGTGRNLKRYAGKISEQIAQSYSSLQEAFTGIRIVKSFNLERYVKNRFRHANTELYHFGVKSAILEEVSHPAIELVSAIALAVMVYYGSILVLKNQMTAGELLAFFAAFALMIDPIRRLNEVNVKLHQAAAAADRVFEIFGWRTHIQEIENPIVLKNLEHSIQFDQVRFSYPDAPEREVLKGISFTLQKGHTLALVGASGSGKSSLVNLLPRIFDINAGSIRIDRHDLKDISLKSLREQIAVVSQDVFLFNDTIEENIRCGRLNASPEEIKDAAQKAHALDFIQRMPHGMKTIIGDRGLKVSGGERQRISIARAFLREAPILILDEATSNLDSGSERIVQDALEELMMNRTTIVIAHRLSTIRNVDQILVLKDGRIVETGTHESLMGKQGEYFRFQKFGEFAILE